MSKSGKFRSIVRPLFLASGLIGVCVFYFVLGGLRGDVPLYFSRRYGFCNHSQVTVLLPGSRFMGLFLFGMSLFGRPKPWLDSDGRWGGLHNRFDHHQHWHHAADFGDAGSFQEPF